MDLDALYSIEVEKKDGPGFVGIKFCQEWYVLEVMAAFYWFIYYRPYTKFENCLWLSRMKFLGLKAVRVSFILFYHILIMVTLRCLFVYKFLSKWPNFLLYKRRDARLFVYKNSSPSDFPLKMASVPWSTGLPKYLLLNKFHLF